MKKDLTEPELIKRAARNDRRAQHLLYKEYYSYTLGVCLRYVRNRDTCIELLNQSFLKVFTRLIDFDTSKPLKPWLRAVTVNVLIDYKRSQKGSSFKTVLLESLNDQEMEESGTDGFKELELKIDMKALVALLQLMPDPMKTVFNMHVIDGLSHKEMSEMLLCTTRTTKRQLAAAREWITRKITSEYKSLAK